MTEIEQCTQTPLSEKELKIIAARIDSGSLGLYRTGPHGYAMPLLPKLLQEHGAQAVEIERLKAESAERLKWANCGGVPIGKTCSVDGHAIYGGFMGPAEGPHMCETHWYQRKIESLAAQIEGARVCECYWLDIDYNVCWKEDCPHCHGSGVRWLEAAAPQKDEEKR